MIGPALSPTHSPSDPNIFEIALAGYDIINKVPVLGARVHPSGFIFIGLLENGVCDHEFQFATQ